MSYIDQNIQATHINQNILLPQAKFVANGAQLNYLQKRVLANYYDRQIKQKQQDQIMSRRQSSLNTPRTISQNPQSSRITTQKPLSYFEINQLERDRERTMRMQLAKQYEIEMQRKELKRQLEKQYKQREDAATLEGLKKLGEIQNEKLKKQYEINRKNMYEQINMAEKNRQMETENKLKEQQNFNQRYSRIPRSNSVGTMEYSPKLEQFRKHYEKISSIQKQIQNNYVQKWSPIIQRRQNQKDKLIQAGIFKQTQLQNQKLNSRSQQQHKLFQDLKTTLIQQMLQKQKLKNEHAQEQRNEHYTTKNYQGIYHPICNPVDVKMTRDNKYILKELKQEQEIQQRSTQSTKSKPKSNSNSNQITGLARNGSYVLLSK